jgi:uncharacterized membrane protein YjgN (DUF898 family)
MTVSANEKNGSMTHTGFVYDGKLGELYGIFLMNLLWTILTFSIFRFWAKTRMRRYLWSRTSLNGDRFEYTGTGGELFIGFLIVMGAYVVISIGIQIFGVFTDPESPALFALQMLLLIGILYLTFVAQYAAQRYRLTRTTWRGINGGMTGSAWKWGFKGMWFSILSLLSLTLAWPWAQMRLIDDRINNSYFGDAKASIQTTSKPLYLAYVIGYVASVIGAIILVTAVTSVVFGDSLFNMLDNPDQFGNPDELAWKVFIAFFVIYLGIILLSLTAFSFYQVAMAREIAAKLSLSNLRFATPITVGGLLNRYIWNVLIIVFTLGLGLPIAIHRTMQFLANNIVVIGEIDGSDVTRANLPRPKVGEGLLEAFDPGLM